VLKIKLTGRETSTHTHDPCGFQKPMPLPSQGSLELTVADSELNFLTIPPFFQAEFFIYHIFTHGHTLHRVIYIEMRKQNREKKLKGREDIWGATAR
jgi:hypothetical protein